MFWECGRTFVAEDGARFQAPLLLEYEERPGSNHQNCSNWTRLMEDYSCRRLTCESDKLVAIAGLARRVAQRTGSTHYYAGIWGEQFHQHLCWIVVHPGSAMFVSLAAARMRSSSWQTSDASYLEELQYANGEIASAGPSKPHLWYQIIQGPYNSDCDDEESREDDSTYEVSLPASYRAPTWSFTAINAPVKFRSYGYKSEVLASILGIRLQVVDDPYGAVKGCSLKVRVG